MKNIIKALWSLAQLPLVQLYLMIVVGIPITGLALKKLFH